MFSFSDIKTLLNTHLAKTVSTVRKLKLKSLKEQYHVFIYPITYFLKILNVSKNRWYLLSSFELFFLLLRRCYIGVSISRTL